MDSDDSRSDSSDNASSYKSNKSRSGSPDTDTEHVEDPRKSQSKSPSPALPKSEGNSSDSSDSSSDESSNRKNLSKNNIDDDIQPEEISDGDMELDGDRIEPSGDSKPAQNADVNISHEDLSDVSDLEDSIDAHSENNVSVVENDDCTRKNSGNNKTETEEGEEQLDFEAEDGECGEIDVETKHSIDKGDKETLEDGEMECKDDAQEEKKKEDLEEGEVSDEDDARPEETEPRPVCRFFSRGQCTWGASCRFLHPGVTDKGNYTMFEMVRPLVPGEFGSDRYMARPEPSPVESAWERGLRTAKEMLRKSVKRKEQDIDFEEKKMNLSLAQEEFDKENGYYGRVLSPEPRYVGRHQVDYPAPRPAPPEEYYSSRRQVIYEPDYIAAAAAVSAPPLPPAPALRERMRPSYRELPTHKMPDYYNTKYEEDVVKRKPKQREVIVQRVEREERPTRADEWSDPWMRSKSPKRSGRKRSYSSGSSYSSSSSTHSTSSRSSYKSRSRSNTRRREDATGKKAKKLRRAVSPSVIVSERKAANERAAMMNPPAPKKRAPSPGMLRAVTAANPPAPSADQFGRTRSKLAVAAALARARVRRKPSRSSSESSGSSSSDSDSSGSSSSSSRDGSPPPKRSADITLAKAMDALKGDKRQIKLNLKASLSGHKAELADLVKKSEQQAVTAARKQRQSSPSSNGNNDAKNKKAASRREELLKQLKAVEDAIAKKRSKVN